MTSMAGVRRLFSSMSGMRPRIHVKGTVVEMDGDEMTRLIWQEIKKKVGFFIYVESTHAFVAWLLL